MIMFRILIVNVIFVVLIQKIRKKKGKITNKKVICGYIDAFNYNNIIAIKEIHYNKNLYTYFSVMLKSKF